MAPFEGWGSTLSRLQSHEIETAYLPPLSPQEYLELIFTTSKGWKTELTLEPLSGFEPRTPGLGIQRLNHYSITSTPDPKVLGSNPNYMLGQALGPNLIPRLLETFAVIHIK